MPKLRAIVTEAKYVDQAGAAEASRKSRSQLRQTIARIDDALFGDPGRLDRDLWLSRIADLLLDGTAALGQPNLLERVRDGIRQGAVPIDLRGYSHIFTSGPAGDGSSLGDQDKFIDVEGGLQEIFTREGLRQLIKAYEAGSPLTVVRSALGEDRSWETPAYRDPAPRVDWTKAIDLQPKAAVAAKPIVHDYDEDDDDDDPEGGVVVETSPNPEPSSGGHSGGGSAASSDSEADDVAAAGGAAYADAGENAVQAELAEPWQETSQPETVAPEVTSVADIGETEVPSVDRTQAPAQIVPTPPAPVAPIAIPATDAPAARPVPTAGIEILIQARAELAHEDSAEALGWLETTAQKLRSALLGYNLQAKITGTRLTPNAALIRFMGSDRLRVEDLEARQSALLTTHGLRLISISPLPGEIVVGVARPQRQIVSLWDVWGRRAFNRNAAGVNTSFVLGLKELDGDILYLNLGGPFAGGQQHEPHTLVAGATGSGKSVLIEALLLDIAATNPSNLAHIYLIDPKMGVDYAAVERLPHLQGGVIVDQTRAVEVMEGLVAEMERRYELFRAHGARDIRSFNLKVGAEERLPYVFLVHDEFAEWMLTEDYKAAVTSNVSRLGVKARAAGMHLIFAAQRPDANVMPMQLRDNLGNRLILKVASVGTSEIALGMKGAEQLLGLGHLAARLSGEPAIIYAQAPFLSDDDIDAAVDAIIASDGNAWNF